MLKQKKMKESLSSQPTQICHATPPLHSGVGVGKHSQPVITIIFKGCIRYKGAAIGTCYLVCDADDADEEENQQIHEGHCRTSRAGCHTEKYRNMYVHVCEAFGGLTAPK